MTSNSAFEDGRSEASLLRAVHANVSHTPVTVEQVSVIDAIGTNAATGAVHLTVSDHLEWNQEHFLTLQEKLNSYLAFVESGDINSVYPDAVGRKIVIDLVLKHRPNSEAASFLSKVSEIVENSGLSFSYGPLTTGYANDHG